MERRERCAAPFFVCFPVGKEGGKRKNFSRKFTKKQKKGLDKEKKVFYNYFTY